MTKESLVIPRYIETSEEEILKDIFFEILDSLDWFFVPPNRKVVPHKMIYKITASKFGLDKKSSRKLMKRLEDVGLCEEVQYHGFRILENVR